MVKRSSLISKSWPFLISCHTSPRTSMFQPMGPSPRSCHMPALPACLRAFAQMDPSAWDVPLPPLPINAPQSLGFHLKVTSSRKPSMNNLPPLLVLFS